MVGRRVRHLLSMAIPKMGDAMGVDPLLDHVEDPLDGMSEALVWRAFRRFRRCEGRKTPGGVEYPASCSLSRMQLAPSPVLWPIETQTP